MTMPGSDIAKRPERHPWRRFILTLAFLLTAGVPLCLGAAPKWEPVKTERADVVSVVRDTDTEIRTARGLIIVAASRPVQIKVYTILGQLVSRENLPAGTHQLAVQAHGVYIIKIGDLTCKVAL